MKLSWVFSSYFICALRVGTGDDFSSQLLLNQLNNICKTAAISFIYGSYATFGGQEVVWQPFCFWLRSLHII